MQNYNTEVRLTKFILQVKILCLIKLLTNSLKKSWKLLIGCLDSCEMENTGTILVCFLTFALSTLHRRFHHINVFTRCNTLVIKVKTLLNLFAEFLPKSSSAIICKPKVEKLYIYAMHKKRKVTQIIICARLESPAKQSMREAIEHLFAR